VHVNVIKLLNNSARSLQYPSLNVENDRSKDRERIDTKMVRESLVFYEEQHLDEVLRCVQFR
jgi:hypothetical protein